jgi:hypothetical protein
MPRSRLPLFNSATGLGPVKLGHHSKPEKADCITVILSMDPLRITAPATPVPEH